MTKPPRAHPLERVLDATSPSKRHSTLRLLHSYVSRITGTLAQEPLAHSTSPAQAVLRVARVPRNKRVIPRSEGAPGRGPANMPSSAEWRSLAFGGLGKSKPQPPFSGSTEARSHGPIAPRLCMQCMHFLAPHRQLCAQNAHRKCIESAVFRARTGLKHAFLHYLSHVCLNRLAPAKV